MITVKTATYSREEICVLKTLFENLASYFKCRDLNGCSSCEYRVLCNDIHSTLEYLKRKVGETD